MLSKEVSSTILKVFGMTRPGIKLRSPRPLANTLPTRPISFKQLFLIQIICDNMASSIPKKYRWFLNRSVGALDGFLTGTTTLGQSHLGSNGNKGALVYYPDIQNWSLTIRCSSLAIYDTPFSLGEGVLPHYRGYSQCILNSIDPACWMSHQVHMIK